MKGFSKFHQHFLIYLLFCFFFTTNTLANNTAPENGPGFFIDAYSGISNHNDALYNGF